MISKTIKELEKLLDNHRKKAFITCPETCLCWDIEAFIIKEEKGEMNDF